MLFRSLDGTFHSRFDDWAYALHVYPDDSMIVVGNFARVGDANRTVTGAHTYRLTYRVRGALNAFPDHDELYWNVIGSQWSVPIVGATVRVHLPTEATPAIACFAATDDGIYFRYALPMGACNILGSLVGTRLAIQPAPKVSLKPWPMLPILRMFAVLLTISPDDKTITLSDDS